MGQQKGNPTPSYQNQAYETLRPNGARENRDMGTKPVMIDDNTTLNDYVDLTFDTDAVAAMVSGSTNTTIFAVSGSINTTINALSSSIESTFNNKKYSYINYVGTSTTTPTSGSYHKPLGTQTGNITYNSSTGLYTLDANKIYVLEASIILSGEGDQQSIWRNHTTNTNIGTQTTHVPVNTATDTYSQTTAKAIIVTTQSTEIGLTSLLRTDSAGNFPTFNVGICHHTIFQI